MNDHPIDIQRCPETGLWVGHVPGLAGAHSQAASLDELRENLREVIALIGANDAEPFTERWPASDH